MKSLLTAVAVATGLGLASLNARAQDTVKPVGPATAVKVQPQRMTVAELGRVLEMLGYNPKPSMDKNGKVIGYNVEFLSGGWTMRFSVLLSHDGSNLWLSGSIAPVVDLAGASGSALLKLLGENDRIWPAYVSFQTGASYLKLAVAIPNKDITPGLLRTKMDAYSTTLKELIAIWKSGQPVPTPRPAPAPAPRS